jgi:hypothetical protein
MTTYGVIKRYVSVCCPVTRAAVRFLTVCQVPKQKCCRTALLSCDLALARDNVNMDVAAFARAASLILSEVVYHFGPYDRFVDVFTYMVDQLDLRRVKLPVYTTCE